MSRLHKQAYRQTYQSLTKAARDINQQQNDIGYCSKNPHDKLLAQYEVQRSSEKQQKIGGRFLQSKNVKDYEERERLLKKQESIYNDTIGKLRSFQRERRMLKDPVSNSRQHAQMRNYGSDHDVTPDKVRQKVQTYRTPLDSKDRTPLGNKDINIFEQVGTYQSAVSDRDQPIDKKQFFTSKYYENDQKAQKIQDKWMNRSEYRQPNNEIIEFVNKQSKTLSVDQKQTTGPLKSILKNSIKNSQVVNYNSVAKQKKTRRSLKINKNESSKNQNEEKNRKKNDNKLLKTHSSKKNTSVKQKVKSNISLNKSYLTSGQKIPAQKQSKQKKRKLSQVSKTGSMKNTNKSKVQQNKKKKQQEKSKQYTNRQTIQKIKSRINYSDLVFEDSQHRTVNHQKFHLNNTFENQRRMRFDVIKKVCNAKTHRQKYGMKADFA